MMFHIFVTYLQKFLNILQYEWGFSRLQNQECRFLQHAEIFFHHAKSFEADFMKFSEILNIKCCIKKWVLTKMTKILRLQKFFLSMQKFLHDAAKITFCSLKRPGYCFELLRRKTKVCARSLYKTSLNIRPIFYIPIEDDSTLWLID